MFLTSFCAKGNVRTYLTQPFSLGAYTFATNGHIGVRVDRRSDIPEDPNASTTINTVMEPPPGANFVPVRFVAPSLDEPKCSDCKGLGGGAKCYACNGDGKHSCDCSHCTEPCDECEGLGFFAGRSDDKGGRWQTCDTCDGRGRIYDRRNIRLPNGALVQLRYLSVLLALPGPIEVASEVTGHRLFFRFAGGIAAIETIYDSAASARSALAVEEVA